MNIMQLPRGTFRSIRKNVKVGEILSELASSRFTGIGTLSSSSNTGTLVFKNGICILAKVRDQYGDPGLDIVNAQPDLIADIALSDLDNAQLQLALDFNKKARVGSSPRPAARKTPAPAAPSPPVQKKRTPVQNEGKDREFIKTTPAVQPQVAKRADTEKQATVISPENKDRQPAGTHAKPVQTVEEDELDTFEDMDLDEVAQKIRKDCKIILKQLQLDHLTEK